MDHEIGKRFWVLERSAFELVSLNTHFTEREYLSTQVNTLTNSLKISDTTKKEFSQLKIFQI